MKEKKKDTECKVKITNDFKKGLKVFPRQILIKNAKLLNMLIILTLLNKILVSLFYEGATWSLSTEQPNNIRILRFLN